MELCKTSRGLGLELAIVSSATIDRLKQVIKPFQFKRCGNRLLFMLVGATKYKMTLQRYGYKMGGEGELVSFFATSKSRSEQAWVQCYIPLSGFCCAH